MSTACFLMLGFFEPSGLRVIRSKMSASVLRSALVMERDTPNPQLVRQLRFAERANPEVALEEVAATTDRAWVKALAVDGDYDDLGVWLHRNGRDAARFLALRANDTHLAVVAVTARGCAVYVHQSPDPTALLERHWVRYQSASAPAARPRPSDEVSQPADQPAPSAGQASAP